MMTPAVSHVGAVPGGGHFGEDAAQARRDARPDGHRHAVAADRRAVDPRDAVLDARVVEQEARREIVRPVEHHVAALRPAARRSSGSRPRPPPRTRHVGVDLRDAARGGDGLRHALARVALGEHRLPLKVRLLDEIAVNDAQADRRPRAPASRPAPTPARRTRRRARAPREGDAAPPRRCPRIESAGCNVP